MNNEQEFEQDVERLHLAMTQSYNGKVGVVSRKWTTGTRRPDGSIAELEPRELHIVFDVGENGEKVNEMRCDTLQEVNDEARRRTGPIGYGK